MSRGLTTAAQTQAEADFHTLLILVKMDFDTPSYAHSGIGDITFDGNTYSGVGDLGAISEVRESESTGPLSLNVGLNALNSTYLTEALEAGRYGDDVTIYAGYRASDGSLVADPWIIWSGWFEFAEVRMGNENVITMTLQHDLSVLDEKDGSRFSDEDQQNRFPGDDGFEFVHENATLRLNWGGRTIQYGRTPSTPQTPGYQDP